MSTIAFPTFDRYAARLAKNGFAVLPIKRCLKEPAVPTGWSHYEYHADDQEQYIGNGIGFLTKRTPAVDVDVSHEECAAEIEALVHAQVGHGPKRIGRAPRAAYLCQLSGEPFRKIQTRGYRFPGDPPGGKAHKVEILADGQQLVAYNIHQDTHQPYQWNGHDSPLDMSVDFLPLLSLEAARDLIAKVEPIMVKHGGVPIQTLKDADSGRKHIPNEKLQASDPRQLREALAFIRNDDLDYDDWIHMGHAMKGALGDAGRDDFLAWSAQSAKDDPAVTLAKWGTFTPHGIGAGTIFYLAARNGWKNPAREFPSVEVYEDVVPNGDADMPPERGISGHDRSAPASDPVNAAAPDEIPWPDPVNIMGEMAAPEFTGDELPPVLSEYALAFARATGFDPSLTISAAVSVAAAALNDGFQIVGDSHSKWFQQARLWILSIGRPGCGKTPTQKSMLGPLWDIQKRLTLDYEQAVAAQADDEKKPPIPRVIVGDATIEALSERLRGNPRGLLLANDEFESWLGSHDAYRSGAVSRDRGEWLRLFDGGPHTIERIQRGSVYVENWGASILTATTPAALKKLTRALPEDGLLQRFIPVIARSKREQRSVGPLDAVRDQYSETINRMFDAAPRSHAGCVSLSFDAQQYLQTWMGENQLAQEAFGALEPALESHLSKYPSFLLRLALTFHAALVVDKEHVLSRDPAAFPVALATIEMAGRFLKRARLHAIALYLDRRSGNDVYELARDVGRAILARGRSSVARRDLIHGVRAFRKATEDMQDSVLRLFVDLGWLRFADGGYSKPTPARYAVNPGLAVKFAIEADRERERRAIIRDVIAETVKDRETGNA